MKRVFCLHSIVELLNFKIKAVFEQKDTSFYSIIMCLIVLILPFISLYPLREDSLGVSFYEIYCSTFDLNLLLSITLLGELE